MNDIRQRVRALDVFLIITIGLAVALWIESSSLKPPFDIYPKMVILLVGIFSIICLIQNQLEPRCVEKTEQGYGVWQFFSIIGSIFLYILAIDFVGYFTSTLLYLCCFFFIKRFEIDGWEGLNPKGIVVDICTASLVTAVVGLVFKIGLKLVFPEALLF